MPANDIIFPANPLDLRINDIQLIKYNGADPVSILAQAIELNIYQSLFTPLMKATLLLGDFIGLYTNYPLLGEEIIEISIEPTQEDPLKRPDLANLDIKELKRKADKLRFFISEARNISVDDTGRGAAYVLELYSEEMLENGRTRVQRAYYGKYSDLIPEVVKRDLNSNKLVLGFTPDGSPEPTRGVQIGNVPNLRPIETIKWFTGRSVADLVDSVFFVFFERFEGFYFSSIQQIIKRFNQFKDNIQPLRYYYISVFTQEALSKNKGSEFNEHFILTALKVNKRFSTYEKLVGGYFENELQEIDITNLSVKSTKSYLKTNPVTSLGQSVFNSEGFIKKMQNPEGDVNSKTSRIRYTITQNNSDGNYENNPNDFGDKFGDAVRTQISFSQVFVTAAMPGDTRLQPGEIIELIIPENHGFDEIKDDKFISGYFLVTNVKHTIRNDGKYVCTVDLFKDAYLESVDENNKSLYNKGTSSGGANYSASPSLNDTYVPYTNSPNNK